MHSSQDVFTRIESEQESYLEELKDYLRIPSISTDPSYDAEVRRCAEFLLGKMTDAGLDARLIETAGKPLLYAEWLGAPGRPTILFYGHYDVQPADPVELWRNPPFEPTLEQDGKILVARGATDDKGQSFAHLKAVAAILAERGTLPVNVKFIVEGEEESGGEAIEAFVQEDAGKLLACDAVFISDSAMYSEGQPSLLYGLKGMAYMEIRVDGPNRDLHSGSFGGAVTNPANALAHIIASLRDPHTGRVLIDGFYDAVRPVEQWERDEFANLPFDEEAYRKNLEVPEVFGEEGYSTLERVWCRPTCDVNGIVGGYTGEGAKTIIPGYASAKISMRLVPDQDPKTIERLFTEHVEKVCPPGARVTVMAHHGAPAVLLETEGPVVQAALSAAEDVWKKPVRVREGGSIPIVGNFASVLKVPVLLMGFGLSDDRLHSPNEKFDVPNFYDGIRMVVRMLDRLATN
ncbi:MAG: dipeptidase [Acidobacteriota bacterium]